MNPWNFELENDILSNQVLRNNSNQCIVMEPHTRMADNMQCFSDMQHTSTASTPHYQARNDSCISNDGWRRHQTSAFFENEFFPTCALSRNSSRSQSGSFNRIFPKLHEQHSSLNGEQMQRWDSVSTADASCFTHQQQCDDLKSEMFPSAMLQEPCIDSSAIMMQNSTENFPALRNSKYKLLKTLQFSLFGAVKLAFDTIMQTQVVIKISLRDMASNGKTRTGARVPENIARESHLMRLLNHYKRQHYEASCSGVSTCICNGLYGSNSFTVFDDGSNYICGFIDEFEDYMFGYLVTEFVSGGDLHTLLLTQPHQNLDEAWARHLFRQMVLGLQFLHKHNVAHLDLSLENICFTSAGCVKIIDFGVAVIHPLACQLQNPMIFVAGGHNELSASCTNVDAPINVSRTCSHLYMNQSSGLNALKDAQINTQRPLNFSCQPIADPHLRPGKVSYMSPELFLGQSAWDAFSNDTFSLGVILYCCLIGRPPFLQPHPHDQWWMAIGSGAWLTMLRDAKLMKQLSLDQHGEVIDEADEGMTFICSLSQLSDSVLDLLDRILKPQQHRISLEDILNHPWMQTADFKHIS